jgi:archaellum component FlaC
MVLIGSKLFMTLAADAESVLLEYMSRFDRKLNDLIDDVRELKIRMTGVEEGLAGVNRRLDRVEGRLERVERRLELTDVPR